MVVLTITATIRAAVATDGIKSGGEAVFVAPHPLGRLSDQRPFQYHLAAADLKRLTSTHSLGLFRSRSNKYKECRCALLSKTIAIKTAPDDVVEGIPAVLARLVGLDDHLCLHRFIGGNAVNIWA